MYWWNKLWARSEIGTVPDLDAIYCNSELSRKIEDQTLILYE